MKAGQNQLENGWSLIQEEDLLEGVHLLARTTALNILYQGSINKSVSMAQTKFKPNLNRGTVAKVENGRS